MKKIFLAALLIMAFTAQAGAATPLHVIFDTDMGNDVDDALALAMLHAFASRGEVQLLAVTVSKDNPWAAEYVRLVDEYYGRGTIPVGIVHDGKTPEDEDAQAAAADSRRDSCGPNGGNCGDAEPRDYGRRGQRQFHLPEYLARRHTHGHRGFADSGIDSQNTCKRVAQYR